MNKASLLEHCRPTQRPGNEMWKHVISGMAPSYPHIIVLPIRARVVIVRGDQS
jgi:hypothetical protein